MLPGFFYRVQWGFPSHSSPTGFVHPSTFYGEYKWDDHDGEGNLRHVFWQPAQGRYVHVRVNRLIDYQALDHTAMIGSLDLYDRVRIFKYGGTYTGTIVGKKVKRVCVAFRTRGGKDKEQWIDALAVEPLTKPKLG